MIRRGLFKGNGVVIPNGLVANYKFNETSGTTVIDSFGTNNGTNNGCSIGVLGKLGAAYDFVENTDNVVVPFSQDFNFTTASNDIPFSISMWVKFRDSTNTYLIGKTNGSARIWEIIWENNKLFFRVMSGGSLNNRINAFVVNQFNWDTTIFQNIIATYDGSGTSSGMNLYINNTAVDGKGIVGTYSKMLENTNPVYIGKFPTLTSYTLNGIIDETEIYKNHVLTTEERNAIWNNGNGRTL